jgi:hypothetical protein
LIQHKNQKLVMVLTTFLLTVLILLTSIEQSSAQISIQYTRWDLPVKIPSPRESNSWFPNLAVDSKGNVHFVWCETFSNSEGELESIYYSMWNGRQWSQYVDIVSPAPDIRRNSLTIDHQDVLHLTYADSLPNDPYRLAYSYVRANGAFSAGNWSPPIHLNERGQTYFNELVSFEETLHLLYEDTGGSSGECSGCADIYYRRSTDGGITWDNSLSLLPTGSGSSRPFLSVDRNGVIYGSWDEGWDRLTGTGTPSYGLFTISTDTGDTWSEPIAVNHPNESNIQLTIEGDGSGGVMLVWRTISPTYPGVYYMWSEDYGKTWTQPGTLPSFIARDAVNYFDSYDMVTDSSGHIHLVATGFQMTSEGQQGDIPGLYHFEWDGERWYPATLVYNGGLFPEYPRMVIERGNQLHVTWFVRHDAFNTDEMHEIMYAKGETSAPRLEPSIVPTTKPVTEMVSQVEVIRPGDLTATPQILGNPTLEPVPYVSSRSLYTEKDEYNVILLSLAPVFIILGTLIIVVRKRQRNMR